ncbi:hypothetical protein TRIATDRAFT_302318 [Trichoderma atroviride IMI 206040]|uniref:F-box domain-containing protein n=1 Tax=Hypocrea atroviridis (strain ATCC 20476 / IMI 206040) TaxID=452589 RepID=G9P4N1_HYPAI|nr:uncharacterized protein TRIATDRAFT_302318 [Trichoderma atroviride IMI 206040]EHK42017.1 hypothetical protein TRIATDRAFT_302318 [Trichoderma atroviride IMI 206040]
MVGDAESPAALPLLQVPPEILDRITWHLHTTELCNFRLTCKSAERAVHFRFTSEFFTRKQFMVSEFSLKALIDISKSRLAAHLRHVHISLDQVDETASSRVTMSPKTRSLYQQRLAEQSTLWTLGLVSKYLADAFSRLPNLETVALRDFNSTRRSRDGPRAQWRSYGSQTLAGETGAHPVTSQLFNWGSAALLDRANVLFKAIIHGLGLANVRLKNLEVMERNGNLLFDSAFHLHPDFEAAYAPVLGNLQKLHLCIDVYWATAPHAAQPYHQKNLIKFLSHCQGLEELRINGKRNSYSKGSRLNLHLFMSWLASSEAKPLSQLQSADISVDSQDAPPAVEFPQLSNLSLGMMALTLDETVQLITKFAGSLQRLELWRFQLMADPGTDVDMEEKKQNLYISLLKRLLAIPNLNLRHIKLGMLQQMLDVSGRYNKMQAIEFTKDEPASTDGEKDAAAPAAQHTRRRPTNNSMEYTGSDWRHFVRHEMMPRLHIINPDEGVDRLSSDEEPEDLSEDDEDEEMDE